MAEKLGVRLSSPLQNRMRFFAFILVLAVAVGCQRQEVHKTSSATDESKPKAPRLSNANEEPPLLLDDEPLLLADDDSDAHQLGGSGADNSRCFVCHVNYMQEDIAVTHARANIGCATCHGESDKHIADESWASGGNGTPPDIMYPRPKINPFCMGCHPKNTIDTDQHKPLFASGAEQKYCTDCHGDHRLTNRKCKWK
ncbi:MAG: multiheme c-type cytochrome [Sedimentisphaerales bacterium]